MSSVCLLATKGARLIERHVNGERTTAIRHMVNRGRPSFEVKPRYPGKSGELVFRLSEPTEPRRTASSGPAIGRQCCASGFSPGFAGGETAVSIQEFLKGCYVAAGSLSSTADHILAAVTYTPRFRPHS